jgi:transposase
MIRPSRDITDVYLCAKPVDFRQSINGLSTLVEAALGLNPFAPALYVFINRARDKIKILYWEKNGFCLWYKRLEQQRFKWPRDVSTDTVVIDGESLNWLLDGFDLWSNQPHKALHFRSV